MFVQSPALLVWAVCFAPQAAHQMLAGLPLFSRTFSDARCRSDPVALDAVGGAAVVSVPCPASGRAAAPPDVRSAYVLSVSAAPVRLRARDVRSASARGCTERHEAILLSC